MKFLCHRDVVMLQTGKVAFKAGEQYDFEMNASGEIFQPTENGFHYFRTCGPDAWVNYFKVEMDV
jgi:hypothetical protein